MKSHSITVLVEVLATCAPEAVYGGRRSTEGIITGIMVLCFFKGEGRKLFSWCCGKLAALVSSSQQEGTDKITSLAGCHGKNIIGFKNALPYM